jgi:3-deoxy-manno-octulosonate cytidylyltransferase (CMP-KDO synthetase)
MIQRVYEQSVRASLLNTVCVATDDERIARVVEGFGGRTIMTSRNHRSGTDRLAEAVQSLDAQIVVNIQGDQPFIDPVMIEEAVRPLVEDGALNMATIMHPIRSADDLQNPDFVKVVVDKEGFALYFSRSLIPYPNTAEPHQVYEHVGLYAYRREFLLKFAGLPPTPLEKVEALEQLRVLEHGYRIRVIATSCRDSEFSGFSVDSAEDLARAQAMLRERGLD